MPIVNQGWAYINATSSTTAPGGFDQDIQFNHHGAFSGSGLLTTDGTGSLSASVNISASAFYGDGTNLTGLTASAVNVADGPEFAIQFRKDSPVTGEISGSGDLMWITSSTDYLQVTGAIKVAGFISASTSVSASEYYIQGGNSFFFGTGNTYKITRNGTNLDVNSGGNVILNAGSGHVSASTNFSASSFYGIDAYLTRDLNVCEGTASIAHLSGCSPIGLHASFSASNAEIPMIIGNPTIGNDCSNVVTIGSRVTASCDFLFESRAHFFGPSAAVTASCDVLFESQVTASTGISSSLLILNPFSGSIAGPGSYLGLDANNRVVVTGSDAGVPSPGGSNTQVQFNDAGAFQGDSGLVYNKTTDTLTAVRVTASNGIDPQGPGTNSIQVGDASARTTNAIAIGNSAVAESLDSIAIGPAASSSMHHSIAIGDGAKNFTNPGAAGYAISIGVNAESNEPGDIAIGSANGIPTHADGGIAIGQQARAKSAGTAIAIGNSATGSRSGALAIGYNAFATASSGYYPTAIGYSAQATAANTIALGSGSINATANSMTIGSPTQGMDFNVTGNVTILNNEDTSYGHLNVCQGTASIAHLSGCAALPITVHSPMSSSYVMSASAFYANGVELTAGGSGGGGIFTEINATQAATTSSVAIGKATAPEGVFQVSGSLEASGNALVKVSGDGGNDIFVVTGSGRVGIGTAAPSRQLDLQGTSAAYMEFNATSHRRYTIGSEGSGFIIFDDTEGGTPGYRLCISDIDATLGYVGIGKGLLSPKAQLHVSSSLDVSNNGVLRVDGDASESILFVTGSGLVGIGTASPAATLTVAGSGSFSGSEASGHDLYFGSGTNRTLGTSLQDGDDYLVLAHTAGGIDVSASEGVTLITAPGGNISAYSQGDYNFQVADADMNMVFKATSAGNVTISSSADNMLLQAFGTRGAASVLAVTGAQGVGINTSSPRVALDVHYSGNLNPTNLGDDKGGGEVVYFGTAGGDLAAGGLYYLDTDGAWKSTNASVTGSGHDQLLGVAMADGKPDAVGMLVKGYFHQDSYFSGSFGVGKPVYIQSSSVARSATEGGFMSGAAPTAADSYVRVVGYGTDTANVIYFNPDSTYVELG